MSIENLHKAVEKADINQVKYLLESNNVKEGSFRLALQNCIKTKKNRDDKINKEIFLLILNYNFNNNIIPGISLLNAFKNAMAAKDSFFLERLIEKSDLHKILSDSFKLEEKETINNLVSLFYMAGRFNRTQNVNILIKHNDIEKICGSFESKTYQNFILNCLDKFVHFGNSPSYLYFWNNFIIDKNEVPSMNHIELSIKNNFSGITNTLIDYLSLGYNESSFFVRLCFSAGKFLTCKKIIESHKEEFKLKSKQDFKMTARDTTMYPKMNKDFIKFIKYLEAESIFDINEIIDSIYKSNNEYLIKSFEKVYLENKIKSF